VSSTGPTTIPRAIAPAAGSATREGSTGERGFGILSRFVRKAVEYRPHALPRPTQHQPKSLCPQRIRDSVVYAPFRHGGCLEDRVCKRIAVRVMRCRRTSTR
jgi:hypothetical protein